RWLPRACESLTWWWTFSYLFLKKGGDELLRLCPYAAPPPGVELDTLARGQVVPERCFHACDEVVVVEAHVAFLVVRKRPAVEIGRSDRRPHTVHDHRLLVEQGGLVLVDLNPRLEQASIQAGPVLPRQPVVVVHSRHHDLDIHTAPLGLDQRVDGGRVGHEIRIGEPDPAPRAHDREVVHRPGGRGAGHRRAHERQRHVRTGSVDLRIVDGTRDELPGPFEPVLRKPRLQRGDGGALDADLRVPPVLLVLGVAVPLVGNAGAAREADAAVDDQRLAVGPVVQPPDSRISRMSAPMLLDPTASSRILTLTPALARSASALANVRPIVPSQ